MINCFKNVICAWNLEGHCTVGNVTAEWLITCWIQECNHPSQWPLSFCSGFVSRPFFCSVWWDRQLWEEAACSRLIAFQNDGGLCALRNLQGSRSYFSSPGLCLSTMVSLSCGAVLLTSWLFTLICIVSCDTSQSWSREMEGPGS